MTGPPPGAPRLIDCDVHCAVPSVDALSPYLPALWRDFLAESDPRLPPSVRGTYPDWLPMLATDASTITLERVRADVLTHAELAILYCYYGVESYTHPYLGPALATAVNRWLAEEWLEREPRLRASALITPQHPEAAVAEVHRVAADPRFVQLLLPARSWDLYGHQRFWPIWDAAAEHGLALAITHGGATGQAPTPLGWLGSVWEEYVTGAQPFQAHLTSLVMGGIFERHADLRVVIAESGWTWLPAQMWKMDAEYRAFRREVPWLEGLPSEYVRRHVRLTVEPTDAPPDDGQLAQIYEQLGSDELLLFASDFPHQHERGAQQLLELLDSEQLERIRYRNALELYGAALAAP